MKITDRTLRAIKNRRQADEIRDDHVDGLWIRSYETGKVTFCFRGRHHGRPFRLTIGAWPAVSLAEARAAAQKAGSDLAHGKDPRAQRRGALKLEELAAQYLAHIRPTKKSWKLDEHALRKDVLEPLGHYPAKEISQFEIARALDSVTRRGSPAMSNKLRSVLSRMFRWGVSRGLVQDNPVAGTEQAKVPSRPKRHLSDGEIIQFWQTAGGLREPVRGLLRFLLLTCQRTAEARQMRWEHVQGGLWTIPAELVKTGREHTVPLTDTALEILEASRAYNSDCPWVFPTRYRVQKAVSAAAPIVAAKKMCQGLGWAGPKRFTPHDLRRTGATTMVRLGVPPDIVERVLNHKQGPMRAVYQRYGYEQEKREALEKLADHLATLVGPA